MPVWTQLDGHTVRYGYEHLSLSSTCIIYIESRVKIQNSVFRLFAYYKLNYLEHFEEQNSKFEMFQYLNEIIFVFYVTVYHPDKSNS